MQKKKSKGFKKHSLLVSFFYLDVRFVSLLFGFGEQEASFGDFCLLWDNHLVCVYMLARSTGSNVIDT